MHPALIFFANWMTGSADWTELRLVVDLRLGCKDPQCLSSADTDGRRKSNQGWPQRGRATTEMNEPRINTDKHG